MNQTIEELTKFNDDVKALYARLAPTLEEQSTEVMAGLATLIQVQLIRTRAANLPEALALAAGHDKALRASLEQGYALAAIKEDAAKH